MISFVQEQEDPNALRFNKGKAIARRASSSVQGKEQATRVEVQAEVGRSGENRRRLELTRHGLSKQLRYLCEHLSMRAKDAYDDGGLDRGPRGSGPGNVLGSDALEESCLS